MCWMVLDLNDDVVVVVIYTRRRRGVYETPWLFFGSWEDVGIDLLLLQLAVSDILYRDVKRVRRNN